jgi:hypothetical protein
MGKTISRFVVGLAVLYALGATGFAFAHYPGEKPDVPTILSDFNAWLGSLFVVKHNPKPPAGPPTAGEPTAPPSTPPEAPTPATPGAPEHPVAEPGQRVPPEGLTGEALELWKIEFQVLPAARKKAHALRDMPRSDSEAFEKARTEILASLSETRPLLNEILERDSAHRQANRLWSAMQEIYAAVKKL